MNTEEDEFKRIEREALRRAAQDDDDTQVYAKPWAGLTEEEIAEIRLKSFDSIATNRKVYEAIEAKLKEKNT